MILGITSCGALPLSSILGAEAGSPADSRSWSESELANEFLRDEELLPAEPTQDGPSIMGVIGRDTDNCWACDGSEIGLWEKRDALEDGEHEGSSSLWCSRSSVRDGSATFFDSLKWGGTADRPWWESSDASSVIKKDM